jgi:hypothetical protein
MLKIGDLDLGNVVVNLEYRIELLDRILTLVVTQSKMMEAINAALPELEKQSIEVMKKKYPSLGINEDGKK